MGTALVVNRRSPPAELERVVFNLQGKGVRHAKLNGRDHLVVPAVMMTEGVHEGSAGPGYYSEEALAKSDFAWNHMPIVVYHSQDDNGKPITARSEDFLNRRKIGIVLNTKTSGKKQRIEAWLDYKLTKKVDKRIIAAIENKQKVEVSTGIGCDRVRKKGKWGEETYKWAAVNINPDHLAVLPDQEGACSVKDGAGLLQFNAAAKKLPRAVQKSLARSVRVLLNRVGAKLVDNELSFGDTTSALSAALSAAYGEKGKYWRGYIIDVYPDKVVFCTGYDSGSLCYQVGYSVSKVGKVSLADDKQEVVRTTEYKAVSNAAGVTTNRGKGMKVSLKKKLVARLVANGLGKETVGKFTDEELRTVYKATKKDPAAPAPTVVNRTVVKRVKGKALTRDEVLGLLSPAERAVINRGIKAAEKERAKNVAAILNAKNCPFKEDKLKDPEAFSDELLAGMAAMVVANEADGDDDSILRADFSGANGGTKVENAAGEDTFLEFDDGPAKKTKTA